MDKLVELENWNELLKQSPWTVGHWVDEAGKYGITKIEDKLKFAQICCDDFRTMSFCRISDKVCEKLQIIADQINAEL